MLFYDRPDCINISPYVDAYGTKSGIFVFKNFLKKENGGPSDDLSRRFLSC